MKNKKIVLLAMCFVSVVLCSTTPQKNSGYSYENSFEETIARALNLDYYSLKNGYSIKNGATQSNAIYDEKGNLISVSSSNDELTGYRAKNAKFLSSPKTYAVNTNLDYNEDNKLVNISTINQNIAFTRENDILKKVEVNDDIVFANNVAEDKIVFRTPNIGPAVTI